MAVMKLVQGHRGEDMYIFYLLISNDIAQKEMVLK